MFTDTKNLGNATANVLDMSSTAHHLRHNQQKSKGKFRKVLKPLLRLITLKSSSSSSSSSSSKYGSATHPNNVNLNNATSIKDICELSTSLLEDYAAVIRKVSKVETAEQEVSASSSSTSFDCTTSTYVDDSSCGSTMTPAVISSASIEKSPMTTCSGCSHGRNCQHAQYHHMDYHSRSIVVEEPTSDEVNVPVHYIRTDNGTFFWTNVQDKIDDDLLNAWLCHSFRQFPTEAVVY